MADAPVRELRVAVTVDDFDAALRFYARAVGLPVLQQWSDGDRHGAVLDAGRATLELLSERQAELVDAIEVGRRVAGPIRLALDVPDSGATADVLERAGATRLGGPVLTPWGDRNVRLDAPGPLQLTLFTAAPST